METVWTRNLSSGEDFSEVVSGMELHERMQEHLNRELQNNLCADGFAANNGGFSSMYNISTPAEEVNRHSVYKKDPKEHNNIYTFLSTFLFAIALIVENLTHFRQFENCQSSISFYWLESCVVVLFFRFWGRKRIRR